MIEFTEISFPATLFTAKSMHAQRREAVKACRQWANEIIEIRSKRVRRFDKVAEAAHCCESRAVCAMAVAADRNVIMDRQEEYWDDHETGIRLLVSAGRTTYRMGGRNG